MAASELKSISNVNLNENKKKLFLYFDNSHTNQTKRSYFYILIMATQTKQILIKGYDFFYALLTSTKIERRLMRSNVVLSAYNRATYLN